ncbi:MAG: hypothetical protein BHV68_06230, partial [Bacteroidales bacterium 43_8]
MKTRILLLILFSSFFYGSLFSQTTNFALRFNGDGKVDCGTISDLNNLDLYSVQCLVNPSEWVENAYVFKRGNGDEEYSLRFGTSGQLIYKTATQEFIVANDLPIGSWTQLTISAFANGIDVWTNGEKKWIANTGGAVIPETSEPFVIGENFKGRIDEFRFWKTEMPGAEPENLMFRNTVNKFHPKYDDLLFYYKFDQDQCEDIVDYKLAHHGEPTNVTREAVIDNDYFKYRVVTGYSSFVRHCDRLQIDRDMHLMTNDLIFLDAQVSGYTGAVTMTYPDNQGVLSNASYVAEYEGRNGVLHLNGEGAGMNVSEEVLQNTGGLPAMNYATIEAWISIEEWRTGAAIFNKSDESNQFSIKLGDESKKELLVGINGYTYNFENALTAAGWEHIAVSIVSTTGRAISRIRLFTDSGASQTYADNITTIPDEDDFTFMNTSADAVIGENFKGYIDEVAVWGNARTSAQIAQDAAGTSGDLTFPSGGDGAIYLLSYWQFDDVDNPGKNTRSWKELLSQIRKMYDGYRGFKIRLGLISSDSENGNKVWPSHISDAAWRERLAADVAELLPYCDGIDVDFEWLYSGDSRWTSGYGPMVEALRAVIFQIYGPQVTWFAYDNYVSAYNKFVSWGFPKEKIGMSYPTTATTGSNVTGYKNIVAANPDLSTDANTATMSGSSYTFNGVDCVKDKMNFILEQNSGTVMYFDMGNDVAVSDPLSLIRAANSVISANVDTLITRTDGVSSLPVLSKEGKKKTNLICNDRSGEIVVLSTSDADLSQIAFFSASGVLFRDERISGKQYTI